MHILQVANFVTPTSGGLRVTLDALRRRYEQAGAVVTTVIPGPSSVRSDRVEPGAVIRLPGITLPGSGGYRVIARRSPLQETVASLRPDVVELSDKSTLHWVPVWAESIGVPTVLISHERVDAAVRLRLPGFLGPRLLEHVGTVVARRWNRRVSRSTALVVAASCFSIEEFLGLGVAVRRVPFGVDHEWFRLAEAARRHEQPAGGAPARLVTVGRLSPEKNVELAIDAIAVLVERGVAVTLEVIGDGPLRRLLTRRSRDLPVRFTGHVADRPRLAAIVATADAVIAPGRSETFGLAALEALACGTPLITPDEGALPELVASGCGVVAPPDPSSFADAVQSLLRGDRTEQRREAAARAAAFDWEATSATLLDAYRALAGRRGPALAGSKR